MNTKSKLHAAQQEFYYGQLVNPENPLYNIGGYAIYKGAFNVPEFKSVIHDLSKVFDAFNIRFDFEEDEPLYYLVELPERVLVEELDFSSDVDPKKTALEWMQNQFNTVFDLKQEKLYNYAIIKIAENEHWWFFCLHHIIADGFSVAIKVNYVTDQYDKLIRGGESNTSYPLYSKAIDTSIKYLESEQYHKDASYWKEKYSLIPEPLVEYQKKKKEKGGGRFSVNISKSDAALFERLAKETNATLPQFTMAALLLYFGKTTDQEVFSLGIPIHNRGSKEERRTVGTFSGMLAYKGEYIADQILSDLIADIRMTQRSDFRHRLYPISHLNRALNLLSENRQQIFDIVINYELLPFAKSQNEELHVSIKHLGSTADLPFPLAIQWCEYGEDSPLELNVDYLKEYFDKDEVERLVERLLFILRQFEFSLDKPLIDISILPEAESHQLLEVFNDTKVEYPLDKTVLDLFADQVAKTPDATAIVFEGKEISYKELDRRSNQFAGYLQKEGIKLQNLVGICLDRSIEMFVAIFGVWKSGGAYVPIDPDYPKDRIEYIIEDSKISFFITSKAYEFFVTDQLGIKAIVTDLCQEIINQQPDISIKATVNPQQIAYSIYTSGSTGKPKGVTIKHTSLLNIALCWESSYKLDSNTCLLQMASFSFDVFSGDLCRSLLFGGKMILCPSDIRLESARLYDLISKNRVNIIEGTPGLLIPLMDYIYEQNLDFGWMKILILGSDILSINDFKRIYIRFGHSMRIINSYGTTETTIDSSYFETDNINNLDNLVNVPIGKPLWNNSFYILSPLGVLLPIGVVGELCIGGVQVARGYLNKEELTKEKFIDSPFVKGERIYKTGDLARWLPDGNMEYIGRRDDQVKIRGYRIELGEIENVLSLISGVKQCCVLAKQDALGFKRLVGYVVLEDTLDKERLQASLKSSLPEYMVPMIWVVLETMPLTSNGKLDKKSLPEPDNSDLSIQEYTAPRNGLEKELVFIWQDLLQLERVGVYDNFFELGGHSLLATRLVSIIRKELKIEVTIREIFENTTISTLGSHLLVKSKDILLPAIVAKDRPSRIPLSFSQERLWFLDQLQGSTDYHISVVLRLEGFLDTSILEQTLQGLVSRHEALRTILLSEDGIGYQEIIDEANWSLDQIKITDESLLQKNLQSYLNTSFDLSKDYKLRACLYTLSNNQYALAFVFHHIASDGWSGGILSNEFIELYSSLKEGRKAVLPELPLQYADYAIWQRRYLEGSVLENQLSYWEEKLKGVTNLLLPTDYPRPSVQSTAGATVSVILDKTISSSLVSLCKQEGVTLFMLMLSVFKVLLSLYSGQDDICVGTPIANRTQSDLEGIIGFFVNTLALRSDLSGDPDFTELLSRVKETTLGGYDHQLAPFEKVVDRVVTTRDRSISPLFQVIFILQNTPAASKELELKDISVSNYEFDTVTSQFDLMFNVSENDLGISLDINYSTALFDKTTIERMLVHYQQLLVNITHNINQPISSLSMLTLEEENQLLFGFNDTAEDYPLDKTIVDLFEQQVKITPDAIAVVFEEEELSYQELNKRSNQLGHYLREQGIQPDDLVGICLERSVEMLVGILGILKSGGAYVPIDPEYPLERIDYMLNDAGIKRVLSSRKSHKIVKEHTDISILLLDNDWNIIAPYDETNLNKVSLSDNLAYVMYTSGSTGRPKGVMITHQNVISLSKSCDYIALNSQTIWLSTGSISFDATTLEFWGTLLNGGQLILAHRDTLLNSNSLKQLIIDRKASTLWMTASWFHQISVDDITLFKSLKYLLIGGDVVLFNYTNKLKELYPELGIINGYGPTENTTFSTTYNIDTITKTNLPIGKPIKNSQAYILDSQMKLVPIGLVGELCVGGSGVARGYLNQDELTREKFVANPFLKGDIIYKTGDLARWRPDGNIDFIGRTDDQVKIRGYRIELGEIENVLSSLSGVIQCCVLAKEDNSGTKRLIGYVVVDEKLDKTDLQERLKVSLPEYMVPGIWVEIDHMPLTSNGKLDRKALPDPDNSDLSTKEYIAPRNEVEMQLAAIWQDLLGVEKIGIHDNFFELGGHSLLVVQLISRLQKNDFHITVKDIFASSTIASMSKKLSSLSVVHRVPANGITAESNYITPSMVPLVDLGQNDLDKIVENSTGGVSNIQDIYPLSPLQEGIHFHYLMSDDTHGDPYILPSLLSFSGKEKRDAFIKALQFVVNRHDVLRTCILSEGLPHAVQVVLREVSLSVDSLELDHSKDILSQLESMIAPGGHWMDISKAPLLQLKSADDQQHNCYYLVLYQHHLILDHVGLEKIVAEIMLYLSGEEASLPIPVLYRDFIGHTLHSQLVNNGEAYFRSLLGAIEESTYPFNISNIMGTGTDIEESKAVLSRELSTELRHVCTKLGITPAVLFHAAYGLVIGRCSNKEYAVFGSLFSGRLQGSIGAADSLGLFINTLPLFLELKGSLGDYVNQVRDELQDLLSYEQTPLSHIHHWSGISNDVPLFSAILNYRHSSLLPSLGLESDTALGMKIIAGHEWTNYPFTFSIDDYGVDFGLTAQVATSVGANRIISYMEQAVIQLTQGLSKEEISIQNLDILPKDEKHQLLHVFNDTAADYPKDKTLVNLFGTQVKETPDAIAVVFEGAELTYKELDERSSQLAHYLRGQGVQPDTLVGICVERSLEMLVGILGILKSGGAYVPIDPEYPGERIDYMISDAGIKLVLSSAVSHSVLKENAVSVLLLDTQWDLISGYSSTSPDIVLHPNNLAYVIYTSGSTGRPKGVSIMHKSLLNFLLSMTDQLEMNGLKSFLSVTTYTFDIFYLEFFAPLLLGAKVIMLDSMSVRDGDQLRLAIANSTPDFMQATPSTWQMLVDSGWYNNEEVTVLVGGEAIKESLKDSLTSISDTVWNLYGPTEATIWVTAQKLEHLEKVTIGKAIDNVQLYILDNYDTILPRGVVGELCIGGIQLASGYLNREELTKQKFITNPFKKGDRLYKTGDLARWLPDGSIDLIGRKDDQVKIRGHRIELGEIENALSSLSGVVQCCVLAKGDLSGNKRLVAYVVMEDVLDKKILQAGLKESLPEYMVPMIWVELKELPLTSNGKLNKKALPDYDTAELSTREYVEPRTETEYQLVAIWQDLLGVERVGIYDNFFELGGHSLLATQLVSVIRRELSIEASIRNIFKFTTVEELASYIDYKIRNLDNETNEYSISINI